MRLRHFHNGSQEVRRALNVRTRWQKPRSSSDKPRAHLSLCFVFISTLAAYRSLSEEETTATGFEPLKNSRQRMPLTRRPGTPDELDAERPGRVESSPSSHLATSERVRNPSSEAENGALLRLRGVESRTSFDMHSLNGDKYLDVSHDYLMNGLKRPAATQNERRSSESSSQSILENRKHSKSERKAKKIKNAGNEKTITTNLE